MSKYQEALDYLDRRTLCKRDDGLEIHEEQVKTLQELIDIASKPTIIYGDETTCIVNLERIDKLEKALDKTCIELWYFQDKLYEAEKKLYALGYSEYAIPNDIKARSKDKWKDYLLSEASK